MDWNYPTGAGPEGIYEMGRRLAEHIGRLPDATMRARMVEHFESL